MSLSDNWRRIRMRAHGKADYFYLTPALYTLCRAFRRHARPGVRGRVLDAGAGFGAWRRELASRADAVVSVDLAPGAGADITADLKRLPWADETFDAAFCAQVLEHEMNPAAVITELARVLRPGGYLILTAPHLSRVHDAPHDYFRFTSFALTAMVEGAGVRVLKTVPCGGVLSFLSHNARSFYLSLLYPFKPLFWGALAGTRVTSPLIAAFDRLCDPAGRFALNWLVIAKKDGSE